MLLINHTTKTLYYGHGKTGTTSVMWALTGREHGESINPDCDWENCEERAVYTTLLQPQLRDYRQILLYREPRSRWISGIAENLFPKNTVEHWSANTPSVHTVMQAYLGNHHQTQDFVCENRVYDSGGRYHTAHYLWEYALLNQLNPHVTLLETDNITAHLSTTYRLSGDNRYASVPSLLRDINTWCVNNCEQALMEWLKPEIGLYTSFKQHSKPGPDFTESVTQLPQTTAKLIQQSVQSTPHQQVQLTEVLLNQLLWSQS